MQPFIGLSPHLTDGTDARLSFLNQACLQRLLKVLPRSLVRVSGWAFCRRKAVGAGPDACQGKVASYAFAGRGLDPSVGDLYNSVSFTEFLPSLNGSRAPVNWMLHLVCSWPSNVMMTAILTSSSSPCSLVLSSPLGGFTII